MGEPADGVADSGECVGCEIAVPGRVVVTNRVRQGNEALLPKVLKLPSGAAAGFGAFESTDGKIDKPVVLGYEASLGFAHRAERNRAILDPFPHFVSNPSFRVMCASPYPNIYRTYKRIHTELWKVSSVWH